MKEIGSDAKLFRHFANFIKGGESMNNSPLITKSKEFALQIIKVCNQIKREKKETVLTNQLVRKRNKRRR